MALKSRYVRTPLRDASEIVFAESSLQVEFDSVCTTFWRTNEEQKERKRGRGERLNFHVELVGASDHADWQYARAVLKLHSHLRIRDAHIPNRCDWIECMKMGILKLVLCSRYLKLFPTRNFNVTLDNYWHSYQQFDKWNFHTGILPQN